ncbi:ATPase with chaperone activity, ATP-binding subunit [Leptolyngbya sp. PCC 7375]|nr:ATPase with chaperone activity, ATP-binding subunit [Leptolyngbya sp. PCC 7375]
MFELFNDKAISAIMIAQQQASRLRQHYVGTELILVGVMAQGDSLVSPIVREAGITLQVLQEAVEATLKSDSKQPSAEIPFTPSAKQLLEQSLKEAQQLDQSYVGPEHLLLAVTSSDKSSAAKILTTLGVDLVKLRIAIIRAVGERLPVPTTGGQDARGFRGKALEEFATDLTKLAAEGNIDPVVGRRQEIERVVQILGRRSKNNPVLIGEPGVGKTAIAEGLAQRIINQDVPELLLDQRVLSLDINSLVAGTRFRGEFEERLKQIVAEVNKAGNIILLIDEIHTLVGAGGMEGGMDAANMLKPALARGELQCIGATTLDEYRKYIEKDGALERRFQPVMVNEPSVEETIEILQGVRASYEQHHNLLISDDALVTAAKLSNRYIADRYLPDKAIDLIDEAGSCVHLRHSQTSLAKELKQSLRKIIQDKDAAVKAQEFDRASELRDQELELEAKLQDFNEDRAATDTRPVVTVEDIAQVVASWTGVPANRITKSESAMLMKLEETLHQRIIGQENAVNAVAKAIRRARVGLRSEQRPIASFIFCGPTGVGKTELTKALADIVFGAEDAIIRLDMSEYMEPQSVAKLIGSPPGYVGYGDGGQLTEAVRRKPYTVVLFDEIEKAHPDVFNLLLQLLDDGRLTDSQGRVVDFKNTVIIMTSNIGSRAIEKQGTGIGFDMIDGDLATAQYNRTREQVNDALKSSFRPEFLNRLDEIIVFHQLKRSEVKQIADILLQDVAKRLVEQAIKIEVTEAFKDKLVVEGYDPSYGARPLRRAITRLVEDSLAEALLAGDIRAGETAVLDVNDDGQVTVQRKRALALVSG